MARSFVSDAQVLDAQVLMLRARGLRQPVKRALQNVDGRVLVDTRARRLARLMSAAISSRSTAAVDSRSSQKAIGSVGQLRQVAREGARRLRARSFGAVHVDRQTEHEADRAAFARPASASRRSHPR